MIKTVYLSHFFSLFTLVMFYPKMKFDITSITLFSISILLNIVSICILLFKKKDILKNRIWFFVNVFLNVLFLGLFTYIPFIVYQLMYG